MKVKYAFSGVFAALFAALIVVVKKVDVAAIGPNNTEIGLATLNAKVHALFGENMAWYNVTDWFGYLALAVGCCVALVGLIQLIKRKSFAKVDKEIYAAGVLYAVMAGLYVGFEKLIINYRPVLMEGATEPEASFPSSHTMLVCVIMGSVVLLLGHYIKTGLLCTVLQSEMIIVMMLTVFFRLISGVHWFTDIIGGVLISAALLFLFSAVIGKKKEKETEEPADNEA